MLSGPSVAVPSSESFEGLLRVIADPERATKTIKDLQRAKREADKANGDWVKLQTDVAAAQRKLEQDRKVLEDRAENVNRQFAEVQKFAQVVEQARAEFAREKAEHDAARAAARAELEQARADMHTATTRATRLQSLANEKQARADRLIEEFTHKTERLRAALGES